MEVDSSVKSEITKSEMGCESMDVSETPLNAMSEEGEISDGSDEDMTECPKESTSAAVSIFSRYYGKSKGGGFVTGFNVFDKEETLKKIDRAKRFAIAVDSEITPQIELKELENLHKDLGIQKDNERHFRFNTIHMRGTDDMSTEDVFQYFEHFGPSHIEWINDKSCNVVWLDEISTARALLRLSKRIRNMDKIRLNGNPFDKDFKEINKIEEGTDSNTEDDGESVDARTIPAPIPPGCWRLGVPAPKSSFILLRYATRCDKKGQNAEKISEYYKKYGNPHFGNMRGLLTNSLRFKKFAFNKPDNLSENTQPIDKKNPWKDLAYSWGRGDKVELESYYKKDCKFLGRRKYYNDEYDSPVGKKPTFFDLRLSIESKKDIHKRKIEKYDIDDDDLAADPEHWKPKAKVPRMKMRADDDDDLDADPEQWRSKMKVPRMKMRADDEEKKLNTYSKKALITDLRGKITEKKRKRRYKFVTEKRKDSSCESDSNKSDNEDDEDDELGDWASSYLDQSFDKERVEDSHPLSPKKKCVSEENDENPDNDKNPCEDYNSDENDALKKNLGHRSPLRIEIDNDEYYTNK